MLILLKELKPVSLHVLFTEIYLKYSCFSKSSVSFQIRCICQQNPIGQRHKMNHYFKRCKYYFVPQICSLK